MKRPEINTAIARGVRDKRAYLVRFLESVGVQVDGNKPGDIQVHDDRMYARIVRDGMLGAGESYVDGWWDCDALDELTSRLLATDILARIGNNPWLWLTSRLSGLVNLQHGARARKVADVHYNLGNEFFEAMLGPSMAYSCGYWRSADDMDTAQRDKHELVCRKLALKAGDRVLDIGCGWGGFARHAAELHGCHVFGITIAEEQARYAEQLCSGLPVEIRLLDYRDSRLTAHAPFDKIVSIGMFEHVGRKNHAKFMRLAADLLSPEGLFLLHTIGKIGHMPALWVSRYIFPNSYLPTMSDIHDAVDPRLVLEDVHNFGTDYDRTLMAWNRSFEAAARSGRITCDDRFHRMWRFYLLTSAASFRNRKLQLWQCVFSRDGLTEGYRAVR